MLEVYKKRSDNFGICLGNTVTFLYILFSTLLLCYISPNIMENHIRAVIYIAGFSFAKLVVNNIYFYGLIQII